MAPLGKAVVVIDENLNEHISRICQASAGSCGVVVGQLVGDGRFLVVHLIRSCMEPNSKFAAQVKDEDKFSLVLAEENKENSLSGSERSDDDGQNWTLKTTRNFSTFSDIKDIIVAQLPRLSVQVSRLLPGGLAVIGIFLTSCEQLPKTYRPKLKEVIHEISSHLRRDCPALYQNQTNDDMLVLSFDPRSKQVNTSLYLDAMDSKSIIKPINVQSAKLDWIELHTRYQMNLEKPAELKTDVEHVLKDILKQYEEMVKKSICLFGDRLLDQEEPLPSTKDRKLDVVMLIPFEPISYDELPEDNKPLTGNGRLAFSGDVVGRAYVSVGASVSFAIKAVKDDLLRSMTTRAELHCEDFLVTDADEQDFDVVHELPRRILASLPGSKVKFANYLSEGERLRDSLEVFTNLLDLPETLATADLIANIEKSPNQDAVDSALESVSTHSGEVETDNLDDGGILGSKSIEEDRISPAAGRVQSVAVMFAVLFAVLFAAYQFFLFYGQETHQIDSKEKTIPSTEL